MTASKNNNVGSLKNFEIKKKIGEGAFSSVFHVLIKKTNKALALKKVKIESLNDKEKENALNEVRILASLDNPNIIGFKEAFYEDKHLNIVMEYAGHGDLLQKIQLKKKRGELFSEAEIWTAIVHLLRGLNALHEMNILHRDIKAANVFLTKEREFKLGDMNVSKVIDTDQMSQTQTGTPFYASPEVWKQESYNSKSDVWSLGCVIYEMAALNPPFEGSELEDLYKKVTKGSFARIPNEFSNDLNNMIKQMLTVSQNLRPSCSDLLASPGLKKACGDHGVMLGERIVKLPELLDAINLPSTWDKKILSEILPSHLYSQEELDCISSITISPTPEKKKLVENKKRKPQSEMKPTNPENPKEMEKGKEVHHKLEKREKEFHLPIIKHLPEIKFLNDDYMILFKKQLDSAISNSIFKPKSDALQSFYHNISRMPLKLDKKFMEEGNKFYHSVDRAKLVNKNNTKLEPLALNKNLQKKLQQIYNIRPLEQKNFLTKIVEKDNLGESGK